MTDKQFSDRIAELLKRAKRLTQLQAEGYKYQRVRVKATTVKAHKRKAHWVMRPMKRKP